MIALTRHPGWLEALHAYCASIQNTQWDDVHHNCVSFVAGAIQAMTGNDPVADLGFEPPASEMDVGRILARMGGVKGLATAYLGEPVAALLARRGDIVLKAGDPGETLGVVTGSKAMFLNIDGAQMRSLSECICAWRVGDNG